mgnify:CR=1 FL=1
MIVLKTNDYFIVDKNFPYINPVICGYQICESKHTPGSKRSNYWTIHYVVSGTGIFKANEHNYQPKAGDCFVMQPNKLYYYQADEADPWCYIWVGFTSEIDLPEVLYRDVFHIPYVERIFQSFRDHYGMENHVEEYVYGKIFELISILKYYSKNNLENSAQHDAVHRAKSFINNNFMRNISVAQIAESLHLERSYFSKIFKQSIGISPQDYITNKRLSEAAILLHDEHYSITQVAQLSGYSDVFAFSRMFKKHHGVSPSEFREEHLKKS